MCNTQAALVVQTAHAVLRLSLRQRSSLAASKAVPLAVLRPQHLWIDVLRARPDSGMAHQGPNSKLSLLQARTFTWTAHALTGASWRHAAAWHTPSPVV